MDKIIQALEQKIKQLEQHKSDYWRGVRDGYISSLDFIEQLNKPVVSGKRPTEFTIEEVIESIKTLWIKDFGRLDSNSPDRDGYFVCGFVREALKAACASGAVDTVAEARDFRHCYIRTKIGCHCTDECGYDAVMRGISDEEQP